MITSEKEQARRRIAFGLKTTRGPEEPRSSRELENVQDPSFLYVGKKRKEWDGPTHF